MVKKLTSCLLLFLAVIPAVHAQGDIIFSYPVLRRRSDTINFRLQLADSLSVRYALKGEQAADYSIALFKLYAVPDSIGTYSPARLVEHAAATKEAFIRNTSAIMDAWHFPVWERDLRSVAGEIAASQVYAIYERRRSEIYRDIKDGLERQKRFYWAEDDCTGLLMEILGIDSTAARKLFNDKHIKREYTHKREIRMWGISDEQAAALGMCEYWHQRRLYEIEIKRISNYLKDILRQKEDEIYWQSIKDALGYDFYCAWSDYQELGFRRYEVSEDKLDEFRKIQKQLEIDRVKVYRGNPELNEDAKQRMMEKADKKRNDAMEKLRRRKSVLK